jgi:hypothetical protein
MQVEFQHVAPAVAESAMDQLEAAGYKYDDDFEAIYSGAYVLDGVRCYSTMAAKFLSNLLLGA